MKHPWLIVLAGGEGRRFVGPAKLRFGFQRPKQFCSVTGSRSMLQHALDRAAALTPVERIVTVIGPGQRSDLVQATRPGSAGFVLEQPVDRGSAAAVFAGLAHILIRDPAALVVVLPASQFVHPDERFLAYLRRACRAAEGHPGKLVLLGAIPRYAECDLGWVVAGDRESLQGTQPEDADALPVTWFRQTPPHAAAARLLRNGALWNTQVFAVGGLALWKLGERFAPALMESFASVAMAMERGYTGAVEPDVQEQLVRFAYREMVPSELSTALLQNVSTHMLVLRLEGVLWADWGRPERIAETLELLQRDSQTPSAPTGRTGPGLGTQAARAFTGPILWERG